MLDFQRLRPSWHNGQTTRPHVSCKHSMAQEDQRWSKCVTIRFKSAPFLSSWGEIQVNSCGLGKGRWTPSDLGTGVSLFIHYIWTIISRCIHWCNGRILGSQKWSHGFKPFNGRLVMLQVSSLWIKDPMGHFLWRAFWPTAGDPSREPTHHFASTGPLPWWAYTLLQPDPLTDSTTFFHSEASTWELHYVWNNSELPFRAALFHSDSWAMGSLS